jgi:hypothetical protein
LANGGEEYLAVAQAALLEAKHRKSIRLPTASGMPELCGKVPNHPAFPQLQVL